MPLLQQVGETFPRPDKPRLDYWARLDQLNDSSLDESSTRSSSADSESLMSIAELLGLNMPRGSLVGTGQQGSHGQAESIKARPQLFVGSPTRTYSGDDSGYQTSLPGSPLTFDMSMPGGKSIPAGVRRRVGWGDTSGTLSFSPQSPSPSPSPTTQGPYSGGVGNRPYRTGSQTISDCGSPLPSPLEQAFMMNSRSDSPESDSSINSLDNGNLSDLMSCLYLQARSRSDSGLSTSLTNNIEDQRQQELANLQNLHHLQSLTNNNPNLYYPQQLQSPLGSPLSSPLAGPDKSWSPGSITNSNSQPGSPLFMSSPLRGAMTNPSTPTSPGSAPMFKKVYSSSLDSSRFHRNFDACDTTCTWSGTLPARSMENATFSVKVFLGGVPWDINDAMLAYGLKQFGMIRPEWPTSKQPGVPPPKGYVYIIFECEKQVKTLLQSCYRDYSSDGGNWYFKISSKRMKAKEVQVIPWMISDANWVRSPSQKLDPEKTVFVGGLHGMLNAQGLAQIMNDLFDGVVYAGIDTDKFKYPIGSARVTFNNNRSFFKAVNAHFVEIKTPKFSKKVQVLPYLEDSPCSVCYVQHGPYFCKESSCFRYFCHSCWQWTHSQDSPLMHHKYLRRSSKSHNAITEGSMGLSSSLPLNIRSPVRRNLNGLPVDGLQ